MAGLIGPDVSHYQGVVDWNQVGGCCSFASSKATEGTTYTDPKFLVNRQGMKAAGLKVRGLYHFGRPGRIPQQRRPITIARPSAPWNTAKLPS